MTVTLTLPWPPRECSPNARVHHMVKARAVKKARTDAWALGCAARLRDIKALRVNVQVTFHEPDRRHRDDDNLVASFKPLRDGLADAMNLDDRHWSTSYRRGEVRKGGAVVVEIDDPR